MEGETEETYRRRTWPRRGAVLLLWLVLAPSVVVLMTWAHLDSRLTREAARTKLNAYVSGEMAGALEIGRIEHLHFDEAVAHDVVVRDPLGRVVIQGATLRLVPDLAAAVEGTLRFAEAHLHSGELTLIEGEDAMPSFLEAFAAADPTPSTGEPFHAVVDGIHMQDVTVTGELLGIRGLRVEDVSADGRMEFEEFVRIELSNVRGRVVAPYPFVAVIDDAEGFVDTDPDLGTSLRFETHVDDDELIDGSLAYAPAPGADPLDPFILDLRLDLDNVRAQRLREIDLEWAASLQGRLDGSVRFHGPPEDLALEATLDSAGGALVIEGRLPSTGPAEVTIASGSLRLADVYEGAPDIEIDGRFQITDDEGGTRFSGDAESFMLGETRVPPTHIEGRLEEDLVHIESATLHLETGDVEARGTVGYDGSADLDVQADLRQVAREPLVQDIFADLAGAARFEGHLELGPNAETMDLTGRWVLTNVHYGPARIARLVATGRVDGPLDGPSVDLALQATEVTAFEQPMGNGGGRIAGGPARYVTSIDLSRPGQRVSMVDAVLVDQGATMRVDVPQLVAEIGGSRWTGSVTDLELAEGGMALERLRLTSGGQQLDASTRWRFGSGDSDDMLRIQATDVNLALVRALAPSAPSLSGEFDGLLQVLGDFEGHPILTLDGSVAQFGYEDVRQLDGRVQATYQRGSLTGSARLGSVDRGYLALDLRGVFDTEAPLADTYEYGSYELETRLENVDLTILRAFDLPLPELEGRADGAFTASGTWDVFDFGGTLRSDELRIDGMKPLGVRARIRYDDGAMIIHAASHDEHGELAELETALLLDLTSAIQQPELLSEMLSLAPWRVAVRVSPRELSTLPPRILQHLPDVTRWRGSAALTIRGGAYQPHADLIADLEWIGDINRTLCGRESSPRFTVRGDLSRGQADIAVHGLIREKRFLYARATGPAPLGRWLEDPSSFELPSTDVEAYVERVPLDDIPYACEMAAGPATVSLVAKDIFSDDPRVELEVVSEEMVLRQLETVGRGAQRRVVVRAATDPFEVRISGLVAQDVAAADVEASFGNGGSALVRVDVPIQTDGPVPMVDLDGEFLADAELNGTPLATALFWMPSIGDVEGIIDGFLQADGTFLDPAIGGQVEVRDGHVELESFGQRLDGVEGTFLLEGDRITLQGVRARDGVGVTSIAGDIQLDGIMPSEVRLQLRASEFPVREEGSIMAAITGDARLRGEITLGGFEGEMGRRQHRGPPARRPGP